MELKELENDKVIQEKLQNLHDSVEKISNLLDTAVKVDVTQLSQKDRIDFDLFLTYALNTLYWMYLKSRGEDPNKNEVKTQLNRVKEYMVKAKQAHERCSTSRPKVDQPAAKRFVKHGINYKESTSDQTPNKKIRFDD